jgi:hypothetical protein
VTVEKKAPRQSGIELLRIVAVTLIVAHHLVVHSSFSIMNEPFSLRRLFYQLCIMPLGKIGITLFLLISLWFLIDGKQSLRLSCRRIWILERELLFWSFVGLTAQYIVDPQSVNEETWLNTIFPISRDVWWYATSYAVLLLLLPFVLAGLKGMGKATHTKCCIALLGLWGIVNLIPGSYLDIYINVTGFIYVTVLLSYYKWYLPSLSNKGAAVLAISGSSIIIIWNIVLSLLWFGESDKLLTYINPVQKEWSLPILMVSFGIFILFKGMKFHSRIVNRFACSAFAVYLITEQHYFRDVIWTQLVSLGDFYHSRYTILISLIAVAGIVLVATVMDFVRQGIFCLTLDRHKGRVFDRLWDYVEKRAGKLRSVLKE